MCSGPLAHLHPQQFTSPLPEVVRVVRIATLTVTGQGISPRADFTLGGGLQRRQELDTSCWI